MAIIYVLSNPSFDKYVKVGKTADLERRLRDLDNTSVPLPFRCEYAIEVGDADADAVERLVHQAFADVRVRNRREFFEIDPQRVIAALKLTNGNEVTPKEDVGEDEDAIEALDRAVSKNKHYSFKDARVYKGDVLTFAKDESVTATVIANKKIEFEGEETSLSKAALTLLNRLGYTWRTANGWAYWMKDDETLNERVERFTEVDEES